MKKTVYALLTVIIITLLMYIYVESNIYKGVSEVCLSDYQTLEKIEEALEQGQIYDYLIVYDLYNKENSKVYKGNINILLRGKIEEKANIEYSENEVLMGDEFAEKNYEYYPLDKKHNFNKKEYSINAILRDSCDIYYNDLSMLENQDIKKQRIYAVLKSKDGVRVDENTFLSILKSKNINPDSNIFYDNIGKLLLKIVILCFIVIFVIIIFKLKDILKKLFKKIVTGYQNCKYDINIWSYIKERESSKTLKSIMIYFGISIILILCLMFVIVKYINLRMPYRFNPVSPKSIYSVVKSFCDFISYYLINGQTEMSLIALKLVFVYLAMILIAIAIYVYRKFQTRQIKFTPVFKIFDK